MRVRIDRGGSWGGASWAASDVGGKCVKSMRTGRLRGIEGGVYSGRWDMGERSGIFLRERFGIRRVQRDGCWGAKYWCEKRQMRVSVLFCE